MPSLTIAGCASLAPRAAAANARRAPSQSSQRSWAFGVAQAPSVIESPNATMAPADDDERTSTAFSQNMELVVAVNGVDASPAAASPEPLAVRYDVTWALPCWLGRTLAPGM